ncbi:MAG: hypothetical protein RIA69_16955 [Cyclobacteriaceae bacterium]
MAKFYTLVLLTLTLLNFANAQADELPLAFSETFEYLEKDGQQIKKTTLLDLTGDSPVEIIIWTTENNNDGLKRTRDFGIVDGDTLTEVSIQQFDSLGNLTQEIDSSNNKLIKQIEYSYFDNLLTKSEETNFSEDSKTIKSYFYEKGKLIRTAEIKKGKDLIGLLSDPNKERTYYEFFEYQNDLLIKEIRLAESDTISVVANTYDQRGNKTKSEFKDSVDDQYLHIWKYDNQGNLIMEFTQYANLAQRIEYSYDSNHVTKKLTYLKQ